MTWDHARGYEPVLAASDEFRRLHPETRIEWEKRSLKDFGDYPVDVLAREYDLIMIDHPHVGISSAQGVLVPLEQHLPADYLADQAANSVGPSHLSYQWNGHQWALAVDAAAQVASYRPDLLSAESLPRTWQGVIELARSLPSGRKIGWPLCPTDAMCSFLTLCAGTGGDSFFSETSGIPRPVGEAALERMFVLLPRLHESSLASNPIQMYDRMAAEDDIAYIPLAFGYSNYSRSGYAKKLLRFSNIPGETGEPRGALLGGVGIAVSASSRSIPQAVEFAKFLAGGELQRTLYARNEGQPGHAAAWRDPEVNRYTHGFFADTSQTLAASYMRPRHAAFPAFQEQAGVLLHEALVQFRQGKEANKSRLIDEMNRLYEGIRRETLV
ncbi:extracellular solute-binding protein [Cohnella sp. CBP 2801]|uniref:Extracellular solute-binding protein n=2 Tax=Cohnella zeiphila TaxID=2761120 RepID=A0A7X0SR07_9BACL|nr:extracellular solute-binding protein [Cohnella zeiphila]